MANPVYPNPLEVAKIIAGYGEFTDWESVYVQHRWADGWAYFRFTAAEFSPMPPRWNLLKFLPGDIVQIELGGQIAMKDGFITDRQVGYDAKRHGVQLSGKTGLNWIYGTSSVDPPREFANMGVIDIAKELYPADKIVIIGTPDNTPYEHQSSQPHETKWDFLETIARPRGIVLGSDEFGNLLIIGDHSKSTSATLIEGVNILKMNCLISTEWGYGLYGVVSQVNGHDDMSGAAVSQQEEHWPGQGPPGRVINTPSPAATRTKAELLKMAYNESKWSEGTRIQASVTVQGWMQPGTSTLWKAGENVAVWSPMAVLAGQVLKIQNVTFQQDRDSGTTTTLDLVPRFLLNDHGLEGADLGLTDPLTNPPQPPDATTPTTPPNPAPAPHAFSPLRYREK
jgi:prophage tail gpP-like protein